MEDDAKSVARAANPKEDLLFFVEQKTGGAFEKFARPSLHCGECKQEVCTCERKGSQV